MTTRKKFLLGLLIIPVAMIIIVLAQAPIIDAGLEVAFYLIGVPIAVVNMWEWFEPEMMDVLLRFTPRRAD